LTSDGDVDPLSPSERERLMGAPRPRRRLTVAAPASKVRLPLAPEVRPVDRRWRPRHAVWELTLRCDLACRHCGSRAGRARARELDTTECLNLVEQLAALGVRDITLIGGEAYLRDDWTAIIAAIAAHGMNPTLTTGGRGMTLERARAAARAGLKNASVSIDGAAPTHDRLRGARGSHRAALNALSNLQRARIPAGVNTQINRLNMAELSAVLDTVIAVRAHAWQIALTVPMGRAADEPDVLLEPYDLLALFPLLAELAARCASSGVRLSTGNNVGYFGPYEVLLREAFGCHVGSCGAGLTIIGIEADGTIKGCPSLPTESWAGGNVRDAALEAIWERAPALRHNRDHELGDLWGFCRTCYYADICRGGCTWTSDALLGRPGNNPYCHHRALELAERGVRERVVRVADAPGLPFDRARFELVTEPIPAGS
jgi:radical SAM protein with 4Fe4S-binding SPASM domain